MWTHCISIDSERAAGVLVSKTFKAKFSKEAVKWFNKTVDYHAIGHLTQHPITDQLRRAKIDIYITIVYM
jgi:hypothetical protein